MEQKISLSKVSECVKACNRNVYESKMVLATKPKSKSLDEYFGFGEMLNTKQSRRGCF